MVIEKEERTLTVTQGKRIAFQKCMLLGRDWCLPFTDDEDGMSFSKEGENTLKDWAWSTPTVEEIDGVFRSLTKIYEDLDRYFLEEERLLFDPEWILVSRGTGDVRLVYLPFYFEEEAMSPESYFFRQIPDYLWENLAKQDWEDREVILRLFEMKKAFVHGDFSYGQDIKEELLLPALAFVEEAEEETSKMPGEMMKKEMEEKWEKKKGRNIISCLQALFSFRR